MTPRRRVHLVHLPDGLPEDKGGFNCMLPGQRGAALMVNPLVRKDLLARLRRRHNGRASEPDLLSPAAHHGALNPLGRAPAMTRRYRPRPPPSGCLPGWATVSTQRAVSLFRFHSGIAFLKEPNPHLPSLSPGMGGIGTKHAARFRTVVSRKWWKFEGGVISG